MQETGICLDFDDSAVISKNTEKYLNPNLFNTMADKSISKLFFFTDMILLRSFMIEREDFFSQIRNLGYSIPYVITPMDLAWNHPLFTKAYEISSENWAKIIADSKNKNQTEFFKYLDENNYGYLKAIFIYSPDLLTPGSAYKTAIETCYKENIPLNSPEQPLPDNLQHKGFVAKCIAEIMSSHYRYVESKSLMLDLFIRKKPNWVDNIVVVDDKQSVNSDVEKYLTSQVPLLPVSFLHVPEDLRTLKDSKEVKDSYQNAFDKHITKVNDYPSMKEIRSLKDKLKMLCEAMQKLKGLDDTNSTVIKEIISMLSSASSGQTSTVDSLKKVTKLAKRNTQGWRNNYANSHFFGSGRNPVMQEIYEKVATIRTMRDIENITKFIKGKNISAKNTPSITKFFDIENPDILINVFKCVPFPTIYPGNVDNNRHRYRR